MNESKPDPTCGNCIHMGELIGTRGRAIDHVCLRPVTAYPPPNGRTPAMHRIVHITSTHGYCANHTPEPIEPEMLEKARDVVSNELRDTACPNDTDGNCGRPLYPSYGQQPEPIELFQITLPGHRVMECRTVLSEVKRLADEIPGTTYTTITRESDGS